MKKVFGVFAVMAMSAALFAANGPENYADNAVKGVGVESNMSLNSTATVYLTSSVESFLKFGYTLEKVDTVATFEDASIFKDGSNIGVDTVADNGLFFAWETNVATSKSPLKVRIGLTPFSNAETGEEVPYSMDIAGTEVRIASGSAVNNYTIDGDKTGLHASSLQLKFGDAPDFSKASAGSYTASVVTTILAI